MDPFKNGKTSIRTAMAMFYDASLYGTVEQNIFGNPPFVNTTLIPNTSFDDPASGTATVHLQRNVSIAACRLIPHSIHSAMEPRRAT